MHWNTKGRNYLKIDTCYKERQIRFIWISKTNATLSKGKKDASIYKETIIVSGRLDQGTSGGGGMLRSKSKRTLPFGVADGEQGQSTTDDESESLSTPLRLPNTFTIAGRAAFAAAAAFVEAAIGSKSTSGRGHAATAAAACGKRNRADGCPGSRSRGGCLAARCLEGVDDSTVLLLGLEGAAAMVPNPAGAAATAAAGSTGQGKLVLVLGPRNLRAAAS